MMNSQSISTGFVTVPVSEGSAGVAASAEHTHSDPRPSARASLDMVERAIVVLEDDGHLNAGWLTFRPSLL